MKKILIVNKSFDVGGIQSSMINMANELSKRYQVDIFAYNPTGVMKERLNNDVKVLEPSWRFKALGLSWRETIQSKSFRMITFRLFAVVWSKLIDNRLPINIAMKHQRKLTGYDLAIAYHQEQRKHSSTSGFSRVVDQCVNAPQKVAWLHYDSSQLDLNSKYNNQFYKKMDRIICVSKSLKESFVTRNDELKEKTDYCYNFINYDNIKEKSNMPQKTSYKKNCFICFSACRLTPVKALDRAIGALAPVFKAYPDLVWYIAGDGPERLHIEAIIEQYKLKNQIILLGSQKNPYPYIRNANLILNVSYHEAAPMIFSESKALGTPVFATRTASAAELLNDNINAFICENSEEGIRVAFSNLMKNRWMVTKAKEELSQYVASNQESTKKVESFIG